MTRLIFSVIVEKKHIMYLPQTRLDRTIIYTATKVCSFCNESDKVVREEYITEDLMHTVFGPGDDDYGKHVRKPDPISPPNELTKLFCGNCKEPLPISVLEEANLVSDSKVKAYEEYLQRTKTDLL